MAAATAAVPPLPLPATPPHLAGVHALRSHEQLLLQLVADGVAERHLLSKEVERRESGEGGHVPGLSAGVCGAPKAYGREGGTTHTGFSAHPLAAGSGLSGAGSRGSDTAT